MGEVAKAIGERGKGKINKVELTSSVPKSDKKAIIDWTQEEMYQWMKDEHIDQHYEAFSKHKFTGRALMELRLSIPKQLSFFKDMCKDMGLNEYGEILCLAAAIRKL